MSMGEMLKNAGKVKYIKGGPDTVVTGIAESSEEMRKGSVFFCIKGFGGANGHDFAYAAVKNGASAVVCEKPVSAGKSAAIAIVKNSRAALIEAARQFYREKADALSFTGITGTKGKTTVSYLIGALLEGGLKRPCAVAGTIKYRVGRKEYESMTTTPSITRLCRLIEESADAGIRDFVMEVSSHALDQGRVSHITFDTVVLTNVTRDHLDYHKTYGAYLKAKSKITGLLKTRGRIVINRDDPGCLRIASGNACKRADRFYYSLRSNAMFRAVDIKTGFKGASFTLVTPSGRKRVKTNLIGRHNVYNALAAAAAVYGKISDEDIRRGLQEFRLVPGRLEPVYSGKFGVITDYAHTPDSLEKAMEALNALSHARLITVFGAGGNRDRGKRPLMGRVAARLSDIIIITTDNPRFEEPEGIIREIAAGIPKKEMKNTLIIKDRRKAIETAVCLARENDIVLLAGKGHEGYQAIKGKKYSFSDAVEVKKALKRRFG